MGMLDAVEVVELLSCCILQVVVCLVIVAGWRLILCFFLHRKGKEQRNIKTNPAIIPPIPSATGDDVLQQNYMFINRH